MDFNVKGITFSEKELVTISLDKLVQGKICGHHLFIMIGTKPFLVLRAGDVIDFEFIQKYQAKGIQSFKAYEVIDRDTIQIFINHFVKLKQAKFKQDQREVVEKFYLDYVSILQSNQSSSSYLSFISACFNTFYKLGDQSIYRLQSASTTLLQRAMVCASQAIVIAMANGFYDPLVLEDLFNICFLLDIGLADTELNYVVVKACEAERNQPGTGQSVIENSARSEKDLEIFLQHPYLSMEYASKLREKFNYPEMIEIIRFHHEKQNGMGFPAGICYSSIAPWEALVSLADNMTEFAEWIFVKGDGKKFTVDVLDNVQKQVASESLPIRKVVRKLDLILKWANDRLASSKNVENGIG